MMTQTIIVERSKMKKQTENDKERDDYQGLDGNF